MKFLKKKIKKSIGKIILGLIFKILFILMNWHLLIVFDKRKFTTTFQEVDQLLKNSELVSKYKKLVHIQNQRLAIYILMLFST